MSTRALGRAWAALLLALCAISAARPFTEADVFWHLTLGREVLRRHARVVADPSILPSFGRLVTVQEWLWDVLTYGIHHLAGWTGLGVLVVLLAALSAWAVLAMLQADRPGGRADDTVGPVALVSSLVMWAALTRIRERPEAAAMVLLPFFIVLARRYLRADGARAARLAGLSLVLTEVFWAQVHPSFVLAPAVFIVLAAGDMVAQRDRPRVVAHAVVAMALTAGLCTSAFGLGVVRNILVHSRGDAVRHIDDMAVPMWSMFNPLHLEPWLAWPVLGLLGLLGMVASRSVSWGNLGLALLGAALTATTRRGIGPGAILVAPFALEGALALAALVPARRSMMLTLVCIALGGGTLALAALRAPPGVDPPGRMGLRPGWYPERAAEILRGAPVGTRVLTSYTSGPPLGWWLDGHVQTYVDSRTPMYYDDAEYALAREVWGLPDAFARGVDRFGFTAAVVERDGRSCELLASSPGWVVAAVEAHTTMFVRSDGLSVRPVLALAPCGLDYVRPAACTAGAGALIEAEARAMDPSARTPFVRYLLAERVTRCRPTGSSPADALSLLPSAEDSVAFSVQRDTLQATLWVAVGQADLAVELVSRMVSDGDLVAPRIVLPTLAAHQQWARIEALLEPVSRVRGDHAWPDVEGTLAHVCAAQHKAACARFHGLRAAALGDPGAIPVLCWLGRQRAVPAAQRNDALQWIATLGREHPGDPRFVCHPGR